MEFITNPNEIEKRSFEIIGGLLGGKIINEAHRSVITRVIHTTADTDYAENLIFSDSVIEYAVSVFKSGANIVTDTQMAKAGINKKAAGALKCSVSCFIDNEQVAAEAKEKGVTRAATAVEYAAASLGEPLVFVVGNAPTALIRLFELIDGGSLSPSLIIGAPVGFVNVVESKELILGLDTPHIVAKGRKGGSNVAAAIVNALLYEALK